MEIIAFDLTSEFVAGEGAVAPRLKDKVCIITGKPELRSLIYDRPVPPPEGYLDKPINEEGLLINIRKILEVPHDGKKAN